MRPAAGADVGALDIDPLSITEGAVDLHLRSLPEPKRAFLGLLGWNSSWRQGRRNAEILELFFRDRHLTKAADMELAPYQDVLDGGPVLSRRTPCDATVAQGDR
jgi:hypothetical protein